MVLHLEERNHSERIRFSDSAARQDNRPIQRQYHRTAQAVLQSHDFRALSQHPRLDAAIQGDGRHSAGRAGSEAKPDNVRPAAGWRQWVDPDQPIQCDLPDGFFQRLPHGCRCNCLVIVQMAGRLVVDQLARRRIFHQ